MRRALVLALGLLAASCGSQVSAPAALPAGGDASRVDMCTILTDPELAGLGMELDSRQQFHQMGAVGCQWVGKRIRLSLERDKDTVAAYRARRNDPAFTSFVDNTVNGRPGVHLSVESDSSDCSQLIDGGPVSLVVAVAQAGLYSGPKIDSCAEALRIAQMIEPRLPKAGS
jgi:hypothetical protein